MGYVNTQFWQSYCLFVRGRYQRIAFSKFPSPCCFYCYRMLDCICTQNGQALAAVPGMPAMTPVQLEAGIADVQAVAEPVMELYSSIVNYRSS